MQHNAKQLKSSLRNMLRQRRQALSEQQQYQSAQIITNKVAELGEFQCASHVALYLANDGEVNTEALIELSHELGKSCYLPCVDGKQMTFHRYQPGQKLVVNRYGIPEPEPSSELIRAEALDLVILPLVGFDELGRRLGMGGGFYDRCFAFKNGDDETKPKLIGIAHACQKVEQLPQESWDLPLDKLICDS